MILTSLGASGLAEGTGVPWGQCTDAPVDEDDAPDYGKTVMMPCLGVVARPFPRNERGAAQGAVAETAGADGVCVGGYDPRTVAKLAGQIKAGETALGATGEDFDSRVLCKEQLLAIMVGDDMAIVVDRKKNQVVITAPGGAFKISEDDGIVMMDGSGKASIQLVDGKSVTTGNTTLGGRNAFSKVPDATKVDAEIARIWSVLTGWTPVAQDGGAALKATAAAVFASKQSTASAVNLGK